MAVLLFANYEITAEIKDAAIFFTDAGHEVTVVNDNEILDQFLFQKIPDVIVCGAWMPRRDIQQVINMYDQLHPGNTTAKLLITSIGATGVPVRYWPNLFDSYVMRGSGTWQLILSIEQFLYRNVVSCNYDLK